MNVRHSHFVSRRAATACGANVAAFTLMEIALSLTIIAFALIAIIGVLPHGMRVQKDNRQETIINQDAVNLMDMLRSGAQGANDLTNYIAAIIVRSNITDRIYVNPNLNVAGDFNSPETLELTNGQVIMGLMNIPKYPNVFCTNLVTVYMKAISGNAAEKPPQTNGLLRDLAFAYRLTAETMPYFSEPHKRFVMTNGMAGQELATAQNFENSLYELRLTFRWPLLPNGNVGGGKLSFRTMISGSTWTNDSALTGGVRLYFIQPQFAQTRAEEFPIP